VVDQSSNPIQSTGLVHLLMTMIVVEVSRHPVTRGRAVRVDGVD